MSSEAFAIYMFLGVFAGFFVVRWATINIVTRKPDMAGRLIAGGGTTLVAPIVASFIAGGAAKLHYGLTVARLDGPDAQNAFRVQNPENIFGPAFVSFSLMLLIAPVASFVIGRSTAFAEASA